MQKVVVVKFYSGNRAFAGLVFELGRLGLHIKLPTKLLLHNELPEQLIRQSERHWAGGCATCTLSTSSSICSNNPPDPSFFSAPGLCIEVVKHCFESSSIESREGFHSPLSAGMSWTGPEQCGKWPPTGNTVVASPKQQESDPGVHLLRKDRTHWSCLIIVTMAENTR